MSVLEEYLHRKGYTEEMIQQARMAGCAVSRPDTPMSPADDGVSRSAGWINYFLDDEMMFSRRRDLYGHMQGFLENQLHAHGYYEITVNICGDVEYIQNDRHIRPKTGTIVCCRPGSMHAFRQFSGEYDRYLMYFSPKFFLQRGEKETPILQFAESEDVFAFCAEGEKLQTLLSVLRRIEETLQSDLPYKNILAKALVVELFAFFNAGDLQRFESRNLSDPIADVKKYIDRNYAEITGVDGIAAEFHYSREHLSRKFKSRFNTSVSEYLSRRRVIESANLLEQMSVTEAGYAVGFRSQSAYIAAFRKNMGCLPSRYQKKFLQETQ